MDDSEGGILPFGSAGDPWEIPQSYEIPLPCHQEALDHLGAIHPWLAEIGRLDEQDAHRWLRERWAALIQPGPMALRDRLLSFRPAALVVHEGAGFLKLKASDGAVVYLGPPIEENGLAESRAAGGFSGRRSLEEFYRGFPALRDVPPEYGCGQFVRPPDWERFSDFGWSQADESEDWAQSTVIYMASNGDLLTLMPSGDVAWAVLSMRMVRHTHDAFDKFLVDYAGFLSGGTAPDSFSFGP
jgi:hypothetical protein